MTLTLKEIFDRTGKVTDFHIQILGNPWSPFEQIAHIHAEVSEVWDCLRNKDHRYGTDVEAWKKSVEESCDILLSTICLLQVIQCDEKTLSLALEQTIQKIENRMNQKKQTMGYGSGGFQK